MVIHAFAFRWRAGVPEAPKAQAIETIRSFKGQIPGLEATYIGINFSPHSLGYELGGVMHFSDRASLAAYNTHPVHQALLDWLVPLVEAIQVDFDPMQ